MPSEIEIKIPIDFMIAKRIQGKLKDFMVDLHHTEKQDNIYLDRDSSELNHKKECLRIRHTEIDPANPVKKQTFLTHKGPPSGKDILTREETEIELKDNPKDLLAKLGYRQFLHYNKTRQVYRFNFCTIGIDVMVPFGWFIEIEGINEYFVKNTVKLLSLQDEQVSEKSYLEMYMSLSS